MFIEIQANFQRFLVCPICDKEISIGRANYKFRNLTFQLQCEKCGVVEPKVKDVPRPTLSGEGSA